MTTGPTVTEAPLTAVRQRLRQLLAQIDLDEPVRRRSAQQAIAQAESWWWRWQAEQHHAAAPRPGDFQGNASRADPAEAYWRQRNTALACLRKAALIDWEIDLPLVDPAGEQEPLEHLRGVARPELLILARLAEEIDHEISPEVLAVLSELD